MTEKALHQLGVTGADVFIFAVYFKILPVS
jgi:hypothetical protein